MHASVLFASSLASARDTTSLTSPSTTSALDLRSSNIRVNAVCPAWVDTPMMQASLQRVPQLDGLIKKVSPLGRAATPEEVVDYILFLCSPSGTYINGTAQLIDAGITLTVGM